MNKKIERDLLSAELMIENSIEIPEISSRVIVFGYTPEKLEQGQNLFDSAQKSYQVQVKELGEMSGAAKNVEKELEEAKTIYRKFYLVSGIAFKDNESALQGMALKGERKRSYTGWFAQAEMFYVNLLGNSEWLVNIAEYGQSQESIEKGYSKMLEAEKAWFNYNKEKGESQEATKMRDAKIDALMEWCSDYRKIARLALEDKPQYLEMLGIVEPS